MLRRHPGAFYAHDGGAGTSAAETDGESTRDSDSAGAELRYTEEDMARALASKAKRADKARTEGGKAAISALLDELELDSVEGLREALQARKAQAGEAEAAVAEARKLTRQLAKATEERDQALQLVQAAAERERAAKLRAAVHDAAAKAGVVDPDVFFRVIRDEVGVDEDGAVFVRGADGEAQRTTLDKHIKTRVAEMPYLQRPSPDGGGGSTAPQPGRTSEPDTTTVEGLAKALADAGFGSDWRP